MDPITVSGRLIRQNFPLKAVGAYSDIFTVICQQEMLVEAARSNSKPLLLEGITPETLLELEFEGGQRRWLRAGDVAAAVNPAASRGTAQAVLLTPNSFAHNSQQRGLAGLVLRYLRVLGVDPVQMGSDALSQALIQRLETRKIPKPGIYRCANPDKLELQAVNASGDFATDKPILLLVHGTFSNTDGSFGDLWDSYQGYNAPAWLRRLFAPYGNNVFALEHPSLTASPVANALQVARLLPTGARLHLLTYSRGGLVGELLCQGQLLRKARGGNEFLPSREIFTPEELAAFATSERQQDYQALQELAALLLEKQIKVERFVRVAAPSRGTVLASQRLEDLISLLFNVLNLIPAPRFQLLAEYVRMVLLATAQKRLDPRELPGLEALQPSSPLVRLLNRPAVRVAGMVHVVAGEVKAATLLGRLGSWVMGRFFGEANDFVVNTAAMSGGTQRAGGVQLYLDQGEDSHHFNYFRKAEVRARLMAALGQNDASNLFQPFSPSGSATRATQPLIGHGARMAGRSVHAPTVYFLPGVLGSQLAVDGTPVWLDMAALGWGDFSNLRIGAGKVEPTGILPAYRPLMDFLATQQRVVEFAYDWRHSHSDAGQRLAAALAQELERAKAQGTRLSLRLLAHSSGGLVVLAMLAEQPALWQRLCAEADCRIVLLGTPLQGTVLAVQWLLGQHRLLHLLSLLAGRPTAEAAQQLAAQFAAYPGIWELLPAAYLQAELWQSLLGKVPNPSLLEQAKQQRLRWQTVTLDAQRVVYLHGKAALTPTALQQQGGQWQVLASAGGDGVALWAALPAGLSHYLLPVEHGRMASSPEYFQTLQYLLDDGVSRQLENRLPKLGKPETVALPLGASEIFPDAEELQAAALGYHTAQARSESRPLVTLRVIHGNLEHMPHPVLVGHYEGDAILSAEALLDKRLGGKLTALQRKGLYPGALNTSEVILTPGKRPGGTVVVGLGEVGKLTISTLTNTLNRALLDYANEFTEMLEQQPPHKQPVAGEVIALSLASLLVGTVGGGGITLADSITALLRAVTNANQALEKTEGGWRVRLQAVDFVEIYEDRAVEAARLVQDLVQLPEFRNHFIAPNLMQTMAGKRRRVMYNEPPGWWRRIQIESLPDGSLKYLMLTDKARAELQLQATQRKMVDQFIAKVTGSNADDPETGKILFELLLPNVLKEQTPQAENVVLVLDDRASVYPWEMLYNRLDHESQPLVVRMGLLRQLLVGQYRQQVVGAVERSALVVGDPPVKGEFVPLPAARREAENVAGLLEAGGFSKVVRAIGSDAQTILRALHSGDYRVLHLAGHGVYRYPLETGQFVTGMVLGEGLFLTAVEIEQMRRVPELVFVNCCHLAQMDFMDAATQAALAQDRSQFAASLAQSLIRMGVRAVIAAGWAVDDAAAQVFAETCYASLLQGHPLGKAVLLARQETWRQYPNGNTWGAYQCYGDPDYKLLSRQPRGEEPTNEWRFVAEAEVVAEIQNLLHAAETAPKDEVAVLQQRLQQLHTAIPDEWLDKAEILHALGRAYGKLELFAPALAAYQAALDSPQADYPVSLLEDKVSLQTAWALAAHLGEVPSPPVPLTHLMADSLKTLILLEGLGNSQQRLEETGKYWKRQAIIAVGEQRRIALANMEQAYHRAHWFALQESHQVSGYPLLNWLTCRVVRYLRGEVPRLDRQELKHWLDQARLRLEEQERERADFCSAITRAEYLLLYYLVGVRLREPQAIQAVSKLYEQALSRGTVPRQVRFVQEHLVFLRTMLLEYQANRPTLGKLALAMLQVQEKLAA